MKKRAVLSQCIIGFSVLGIFMAIISSGGCKKDPLTHALFDEKIPAYLYALFIQQPLSITNITIVVDQLTGTGATINFNTNVQANYQIFYREWNWSTCTYESYQSVSVATYNTVHTTNLAGLTALRTYQFYITCRDKSGNTIDSVNTLFYTDVNPADGWYKSFTEHTENPVHNPGSTSYYSSVLYDVSHFGNSIGDYVKGSGGDTYQVLPYYKMWVGDGANTDFSYSENGIAWYYPATGQNLMPIILPESVYGYHPTVIYSASQFSGETKQDPATRYRMWNWPANYNSLQYYESSDGVNFIHYPSVNIQNTLAGGSAPVYSIAILYRPASNPRYEGWIDNNGILYYVQSNDCMTWTAYPGLVSLDNRITHSGKTGAAPGSLFYVGGYGTVIYFNSKYTMWYSSGITGIENSNYNRGISYAESTDGLTWQLVDMLPDMGVNGSPAGFRQNAIYRIDDILTGFTNPNWRNSRTYNPVVVYDSDRFSGHGEYKMFKMWLTGDGSIGRRIGYASFNEP